ncbi:acyltransferase [Hyphomicrobium sp. B1]|uniref:acyltransferase family protein n=1 Tax=Hyphomicrobium sp. B1 TaxID=3075651 RepID=UPI003C30B429
MRAHIYPLDAVRFFAALCVMLFHLSFYDWASTNSVVGQMFANATSFTQAAPYTSFGWVGVEIFFVISGFVIANSANNSSPIAFLKSRVLRLYPAAWICICFTVAAWLLAGGVSGRHLSGEFLRSITLWIFGPWVDGIYWSLAVELVFYAIIFFLLLSSRFDCLTHVAWALTTISGAFLISVSFVPSAHKSHLGWQIVAYSDVLQLRYGCFFAFGIWMWLFSRRTLGAVNVFGMVSAFAICILEIVSRSHDMAKWEVHPGVPVSQVLPAAVWIGTIMCMLVIVRDDKRFTPVSPRLQNAFKNLGLMTYPLYLIHSVVGAFLIRVMVRSGINPWIALTIAVLSMLSLAYEVSRYGEPPVRRLLRAAWERGEASLRSVQSVAFLFRSGGRIAT